MHTELFATQSPADWTICINANTGQDSLAIKYKLARLTDVGQKGPATGQHGHSACCCCLITFKHVQTLLCIIYLFSEFQLPLELGAVALALTFATAISHLPNALCFISLFWWPKTINSISVWVRRRRTRPTRATLDLQIDEWLRSGLELLRWDAPERQVDSETLRM